MAGRTSQPLKKTSSKSKTQRRASKVAHKVKRVIKGQKTKRTKSNSSTQKRKNQRTKGKKPSEFNLYMKTALSQIKQQHPEIAHKEAFKRAAEQWSMRRNNSKMFQQS